jgi:hypothetical protein
MATEKQLAALKKARAARAKKAKVATKPNLVVRKKAKPAIKSNNFAVEVKLRGNRVGYITGHMGLDTSISAARKMTETTAEKVAKDFFNENKKHLLHVRVIELKK